MATENTADLGDQFWQRAQDLLFKGLNRYVDAEITDQFSPQPQKVTTASPETGKVFEAGRPVTAPATAVLGSVPFLQLAVGGALLALVVYVATRG